MCNPEYQRTTQVLQEVGGHIYDRVGIANEDGERQSLYHVITDWWR